MIIAEPILKEKPIKRDDPKVVMQQPKDQQTLKKSTIVYMGTFFLLHLGSLIGVIGALLFIYRSPIIEFPASDMFKTIRLAGIFLLTIYSWSYAPFFLLFGFCCIKFKKSWLKVLMFFDNFYFVTMVALASLFITCDGFLVYTSFEFVSKTETDFFPRGYIYTSVFTAITGAFALMRTIFTSYYGFPKKEDELSFNDIANFAN